MRKKRKPRKVEYVFCYALFAIVLVLAYYVFMIWQHTILVLGAMILGDGIEALFWTKLAYGAGTITLGLALMCVLMYAEPYLRDSLYRGELLKRFARFAVPMAAICVAGVAVQTVAFAIG